MTERTPMSCFKQLQPALEDMSNLVHTAPLKANERQGLAVLVAGYTFAMVAAEMGVDPQSGAREVAELIVGSMELTKH